MGLWQQSWLSVKNQNWDQIRDCHHQQASNNAVKAIYYGVAFAKILVCVVKLDDVKFMAIGYW